MAITDGLFALNINCMCCAFGPGSIESRGLLFGAETAPRIQASEWDSFSGRGLKWNMRPRARNGAAAQLYVRASAYPYGNVAAYVASGRQRRKALTVSAEKDAVYLGHRYDELCAPDRAGL